MATAIREIELSGPLGPLEDLHGYARAMLVVRWHRRVLGRAFVRVADGRLDEQEVRSAIRAGLPADAWLRWLEDTVGYDERARFGGPLPPATIAICTRERPVDLRRALQAVSRVVDAVPGTDVLVIDNAPASDATRRVVQDYPRVRYICEPRRGLNVARNRALIEARGEIVAFTDDDAAPEAEWLDALRANFGDPRVLCVTGLTLPAELETEAQELFEEHTPFGRGFRRHVFDGQRDNPLHVGPVGAGANMAVRRNIAGRVGPFDERLDGGTPTRSGGDHEMFARILGSGYRIVYDPAAVSWHTHRRSMESLFGTVYGYGVGVYAMWTGLLLERRELGAIKLAWAWFRHGQVPLLLSGLRDRGHHTRAKLVREELRGCLHGPRAWFQARRLRHAGS